MIAKSFKMKLKQGYKAEYKRRHAQIWPELKKALKKAGIIEYYIYLDEETGSLFAFQKLSDDHRSDQLPELPIMWDWWDYMKEIMEVNPDHSPVEVPLEEVFCMDG